ncbi:MAG TPA: hypothetical protein P5136_02640 [Methanofastidiosum sp.]|nr:hypothetical protein [Methanofastidiosum sp.]
MLWRFLSKVFLKKKLRINTVDTEILQELHKKIEDLGFSVGNRWMTFIYHGEEDNYDVFMDFDFKGTILSLNSISVRFNKKIEMLLFEYTLLNI